MGPEITNDGPAAHADVLEGEALYFDPIDGHLGDAPPEPAAPTVEPSAPHQRIPALDGLRGLAVIGVVLFHAGHLTGGFLGVDLFFVLSGYLITTVLLRSVGPDGSLGLRRFWSRRARRLLPALIVVIVIVLPIYAIWFATPTDLDPVKYDGIGSLLYITNWTQILHGQSYFTSTLAESPLRHMWSLAIEEQFYLFWPLLLMAAVRRGGTRAVFILACVLGTASAGLMIVLGATRAVSFNSLYLGTHTRAASVLAGGALAAWFAMRGTPSSEPARRWLHAGAVAAGLILAGMWATMEITSPSLYVGGMAIAGLLGTLLVAACVTLTDGPFIRVLSVAPLQQLGIISYGVYLWSWPIMVLVSERHTNLSGWTLLFVQLVLIVNLAVMSWLWIERPILHGAPHPPWSERLLVIGATAAAVAVVTSTAGSLPTPTTKVSTEGYAMSSVDGAPKLLVVGDSLPGRIAQEGIIPQKDLLGVSTVDRTVPGCILLRSVGEVKGIEGNVREDVRPCNNQWGRLAERYQPDVVLVLFGEFPNDQVKIDGTFHLPCAPAYQREERAALNEAFTQLTASGARVVISTAPGTSVSWVLDGVPPGMNGRVSCMNRLYREVAAQHPNVDVVDLASFICPPGERCKDQIDGIDLRPDTVHFRDESAELVSRWLIAKVLGTEQIEGPKTTAAPMSKFCRQLTSIYDRLTGFSTERSAGPGSKSRVDFIESMRDIPPGFATSVPEELKDDVALFVAEWDSMLDRVAELPAKPTDADLQVALGHLVAPLTNLVTWSQANCD